VSDFIDIGPECFAAKDKSVISWQGQNYVPQPQVDVIVLDKSQQIDLAKVYDDMRVSREIDTVLGFDVNDFESKVYYAIFNDPDAPEYAALHEAMRPLLLETPLYEDESLPRVIKHAKLTNEDRDRMTPPVSHVVVRAQTILKTPWTDVELTD